MFRGYGHLITVRWASFYTLFMTLAGRGGDLFSWPAGGGGDDEMRGTREQWCNEQKTFGGQKKRLHHHSSGKNHAISATLNCELLLEISNVWFFFFFFFFFFGGGGGNCPQVPIPISTPVGLKVQNFILINVGTDRTVLFFFNSIHISLYITDVCMKIWNSKEGPLFFLPSV